MGNGGVWVRLYSNDGERRTARVGLSYTASRAEVTKFPILEATSDRHYTGFRTIDPSIRGITMSTTQEPTITLSVTPAAGVEVKKFMEQEGVAVAEGGLRVSVQPGGCSGFRYGLLIEEKAADDDIVLDQEGYKVFVDPFSAQYLNGVTIDYVSSMQGSGFTFKNPNATGGCGCGSSFTA